LDNQNLGRPIKPQSGLAHLACKVVLLVGGLGAAQGSGVNGAKSCDKRKLNITTGLFGLVKG